MASANKNKRPTGIVRPSRLSKPSSSATVSKASALPGTSRISPPRVITPTASTSGLRSPSKRTTASSAARTPSSAIITPTGQTAVTPTPQQPNSPSIPGSAPPSTSGCTGFIHSTAPVHAVSPLNVNGETFDPGPEQHFLQSTSNSDDLQLSDREHPMNRTYNKASPTLASITFDASASNPDQVGAVDMSHIDVECMDASFSSASHENQNLTYSFGKDLDHSMDQSFSSVFGLEAIRLSDALKRGDHEVPSTLTLESSGECHQHHQPMITSACEEMALALVSSTPITAKVDKLGIDNLTDGLHLQEDKGCVSSVIGELLYSSPATPGSPLFQRSPDEEKGEIVQLEDEIRPIVANGVAEEISDKNGANRQNGLLPDLVDHGPSDPNNMNLMDIDFDPKINDDDGVTVVNNTCSSDVPSPVKSVLPQISAGTKTVSKTRSSKTEASAINSASSNRTTGASAANTSAASSRPKKPANSKPPLSHRTFTRPPTNGASSNRLTERERRKTRTIDKPTTAATTTANHNVAAATGGGHTAPGRQTVTKSSSAGKKLNRTTDDSGPPSSTGTREVSPANSVRSTNTQGSVGSVNTTGSSTVNTSAQKRKLNPITANGSSSVASKRNARTSNTMSSQASDRLQKRTSSSTVPKSSTAATGLSKTRPKPDSKSTARPPAATQYGSNTELSQTSSTSSAHKTSVTRASKTAGTKTHSPSRSTQPSVVSATKGVTTRRGSSTSTANSMSQLRADLETRQQRISQLESAKTTISQEKDYWQLGFTALASIIQYLNTQISQERILSQRRLDESKAKSEELSTQMTSQASQFSNSMEQLQNDAERSLRSLREQLERQHQSEIDRIIDQHSHEVVTLKSYHEKDLNEMRLKFEKDLTILQQQHSNDELYIAQLRDQEQAFRIRETELTQRFEEMKCTYSEKVNMLVSECAELRTRSKHYEELQSRDMNAKLESAIKPYLHMPAEIDSLRAVIDLKSQEVHQLREKNAQSELRLGNLTELQDKIKSLEHELENVKEICKLKSDSERVMSEKYRHLLNKFEKENRANKRLSMNNEELSWKLSQSIEGVLPLDPMSASLNLNGASNLAAISSPRSARRNNSARTNTATATSMARSAMQRSSAPPDSLFDDMNDQE